MISLVIAACSLSLYVFAEAFEVTVKPEGSNLVLRYTGSTNHYYVAYSGTSVQNIATAVDLSLGQSPTGTLSTPYLSISSERVYYRVHQCSLANAVDTDLDGLDDVFELQFGLDA